MSHSNESLHHLTETVNTLAKVVAKQESRYLSLEKTFKWVAIAFICLTLMVFYIGFNRVSTVQAGIGEVKPVIPAIERIATVMERIVNILPEQALSNSEQGMELFTTSVHDVLILLKRIKEDSDLLRQQAQANQGTGLIQTLEKSPTLKEGSTLVANLNHALTQLGQSPILKEAGTLVTHLNHSLTQLEQSTLLQDTDTLIKQLKQASAKFEKSQLLQSIEDAAILIHRLKLDSDSLRERLKVGERSGLFTYKYAEDIHRALVDIKVVLSAVPIMTEEVHQMNLKMGVMTHDMDSSMGRMGRMMPGGPGGWWW